MKRKKEQIKLIKTLKIDRNEYWILSSGALVIRGIYPDAGDLDIDWGDWETDIGYYGDDYYLSDSDIDDPVIIILIVAAIVIFIIRQ